MIHAVQYNITTELLALNGAVLGASVIMANNAPMLLDGAFMAASVVHFRHDMPDFRELYIPKFVLSGLLLMLSIHQDPNILFRYMVLMHVPNHYIMNWKFIRKNPHQNIGLVVVFSLLLVFLGESFPWMFESKLLFDMSKGIIISHVLYNEKHIHRNPAFYIP